MKQLVCEACGGKELIRQGDVLVCSHCDTKYSVKEEKTDFNDFIQSFFTDAEHSDDFSEKTFETNTNTYRTKTETIIKTKTEKNNFNFKEKKDFNDFVQSFFDDAEPSKSNDDFIRKTSEMKAEPFRTETEENNFDWTALFYLSLFLGWLGADRFYVGKKVSGIIKFLLFLSSFIIYISPLSSAPVIFIILVWWLLDLYCIVKGEFAGFQKES